MIISIQLNDHFYTENELSVQTNYANTTIVRLDDRLIVCSSDCPV